MPPRKSAAERQRQYREKLKREQPEKYKQLKEQAAARALEYYKRKQGNLTEEQKEEQRLRRKQQEQNAKNLLRKPKDKTYSGKRKTGAERQKQYREKLKREKAEKYKQLKEQTAARALEHYKRNLTEEQREQNAKIPSKPKVQRYSGEPRAEPSQQLLPDVKHEDILQQHTSYFNIRFPLKSTERDASSYFVKEGGDRWRCRLCRTVVNDTARWKTHVEDHHSGQNYDSDDQDNDEEAYSEVVYLEEETPIDIKEEPSTSGRRSPRTRPTDILSHRRKEETREIARTSVNEDVSSPTKVIQNDEIEQFSTYIVSLLRTLPKKVCTKLQMEIINKIMTEKLKIDSSGVDKMVDCRQMADESVQDSDVTETDPQTSRKRYRYTITKDIDVLATEDIDGSIKNNDDETDL